MKIYKKLFILTLITCFFVCVMPIRVNADELFSTDAKSAYLIDYDSGEVLYAFNENNRLPIASMTKIMLLDIVFEAIETKKISLSQSINVSEKASGMGGSQVFLQAGKNYLISDLVKSVIIASANDASVALAEEVAGSEDVFVANMNNKAKDMGLKNTLFSNCTGLPKPTQYSSAKDVALMFKSLLRHNLYYQFSNIWLDELVHPDNSTTVLTNTNKLTRSYNGCDGGKTGFTNEAKFCLAATAKRNNMRLISVVIGEDSSDTRFNDVARMFDNAFNNYESNIIVDCTQPINENVKIKCSQKEKVFIYPKNNLCMLSKKGVTADYSTEVFLKENLVAPISCGEEVGEIILYKDGVEYAKTKLIVKEEINEIGFGDSLSRIADNW